MDTCILDTIVRFTRVCIVSLIELLIRLMESFISLLIISFSLVGLIPSSHASNFADVSMQVFRLILSSPHVSKVHAQFAPGIFLSFSALFSSSRSLMIPSLFSSATLKLSKPPRFRLSADRRRPTYRSPRREKPMVFTL